MIENSVSNSEDTAKASNDIPVDTGAFQSSIDYVVTAQMRMDLAMSQIQKYTSLADFDDEAETLRKAWGVYYKEIKPLFATEKYEDVFNIPMPEQA